MTLEGLSVSKAAELGLSVLSTLYQKIEQKVTLVRGAQDQVQSFENDVEIIKSFMLDAESVLGRSDVERTLISQLRKKVYEAEDVIERHKLVVRRRKMSSKLRKFFNSYNHVNMLQEIADSIEKLNGQIRSTQQSGSAFQSRGYSVAATEDAAAEWSLRRLIKERIMEGQVVRFRSDLDMLLMKLITGNEMLQVISITGMGGSGKTTLAKMLCDDERVKDHFPNCIFHVTAGQSTASEILRQIMHGIMKRTAESEPFPLKYLRLPWSNANEDLPKKAKRFLTNEKKLQSKETKISDTLKNKDRTELLWHLQNLLSHQKCLIVIDDIWEPDVLDDLRKALLAINKEEGTSKVADNKQKGCRILITTRIKGVANYGSSSHPIEKLSDEESWESWELLRKTVFETDEPPSDLEKSGKDIAKGCYGLPLPIVELGRFLKTKERKSQVWSRINVNSYLDEVTQEWKKILALSYNHIKTPLLKECFLYCGVFPYNFEVPASQLFQLWIAEGLIPHSDTRSMEETANDYLEELVDKSLVEPTKHRIDGQVKACRIHGLLGKLCVSESKKRTFYEVATETNVSSPEGIPRRLSVHCATREFISRNIRDLSLVRSFLCFGDNKYSSEHEVSGEHELSGKHLWEWVFKNVDVVRVLILGKVNLKSIPEKIRDLVHLRYLKVGTADLECIPDSISDLCNLETLDLRGSEVNSLPKKIWKLKKLRHIHLSKPTKLKSSKDFIPLADLQVVSKVVMDQELVGLITKKMLPNVIKLGLVHGESQQSWKKSVRKIFHRDRPIADHIRNYFDALGRLTKLRILKVRGGTPITADMDWSFNGFPELRELQIEEFPVQNWTLDANAMPQLQRLVIKKCTSLKSLPEELWELQNLQKIEVQAPSSEMANILEEKNDSRIVIKY